MTINQDGPNTAGAAEPVAWMYEATDGERTFEFNPNGESARWLIENGYTEIPLYAHPPENPPKRPSVVPDDIEVLLSAVENGKLTNVDRHLNARMCCDGHMCGCRGSTVGEYLAYELRTALTAAIPAMSSASTQPA